MIYMQGFFSVLSVMIAVNIIAMKKIKWNHQIICFVIAYLSAVFVGMFNEPIGTIMIVINLIVLMYCYNVSIKYSIVYVGLSVVIMIVSSAIIDVILLNLVYNSDVSIKNTMIDNPVGSFIYGIMMLFFSFSLSKICGKVINKKRINKFSKLELMYLITCPLVTTIVFTITFNDTKPASKVIAVFILFIVVVTFLSIIIVRDEINDEKIKTQKEIIDQLQQYAENLEHLYNDVRKFKHDYLNILASLTGFMEEEDYEGLGEYFSNEIIPFSCSISNNSNQISHLSKIKNNELKGILSIKIIQAQEQNIEVSVNIVESIDNISFGIELCKTIGLMLDNAIEESKLYNKPKIEIDITNKEEDFVLIIKNNSDKVIIFDKNKQEECSRLHVMKKVKSF